MARGCLAVIGSAIVLVVVVVWSLGPSLATAVITGALASSGFHSTTRTVTVTTDPPLELLLGRIDSVRVRATDVDLRGLEAADLDVTLGDIRLLDRTYATVEGTMSGATVHGAGGDVPVSSVSLSGPAAGAATTVRIPATRVADLIREGIGQKLGVTPARVALSAPDVVTVEALGRSLPAILAVDAQGRVVLQPLGSDLLDLVVMDPSTIPGFTVSKVSVAGEDVVVEGFVDLPLLIPLGGD